MTPKILTKRLQLDPLRSTDAPTLWAYRSRPEVARYLSWVPETLEDAETYVRESEEVPFQTPGTWFQLAIRLRESDRLLGDLGLHFLAEDDRRMELGFAIDPSHQRKGYASEALRGLLGYLFRELKIREVKASADPLNQASIALLDSLGFRRLAQRSKSFWFKGEWVDDLPFVLPCEEWRSATEGNGATSERHGV